MSDRPEGFGNSFMAVMLVLVIAIFLFSGEPDVFNLAQDWVIEYFIGSEEAG